LDILGNTHLSFGQIENAEGKTDKGAALLIMKKAVKMKSKTKNKPKTEKQTNQTKNKGKKDWKQR
jgi:hypothetical protein